MCWWPSRWGRRNRKGHNRVSGHCRLPASMTTLLLKVWTVTPLTTNKRRLSINVSRETLSSGKLKLGNCALNDDGFPMAKRIFSSIDSAFDTSLADQNFFLFTPFDRQLYNGERESTALNGHLFFKQACGWWRVGRRTTVYILTHSMRS